MTRVIRPTTFSTWLALLEFDVQNPANHLPVSAVVFGVKFQLEFDRLWQLGQIAHNKLNEIKNSSKSFLLELLKEMRKRLSTNVQQLESLAQLAPSVVLGENKPQLQKLSFIGLFDGDLNTLDVQWQMISTVEWKDAKDVGTEDFWVTVLKYTDAAGENVFSDLAKIALALPSLPFSNGSVERMFSQMNLLKTKLRNRMKQEMLEAIMLIRSHMQRNEICCNKFTVSQAMIRRCALNYYDDSSALPDIDF